VGIVYQVIVHESGSVQCFDGCGKGKERLGICIAKLSHQENESWPQALTSTPEHVAKHSS